MLGEKEVLPNLLTSKPSGTQRLEFLVKLLPADIDTVPEVLRALEKFCWLAKICLPAGSIGLLLVVFQSCVILSPEVR